MILKYPLGLLGLLGIPVLILIYIIKSKYTEQTIASTYLWRLSDRFLKHKKHKKRVTGLISLLLQIFTITLLSLIISHPVITLPNAAREYCFILDASGSMNMVENGLSRLDLGKEKITEIINNSVDGSTYSIVTVKDEAEVLLNQNSSKEKTIDFLNGIRGTDMSSSCVDSLGFAQYYFDQNKSVKTYLVTDKKYETTNVSLIDVSTSTLNLALMNTKLEEIKGANSKIEVKGEAISYNAECEAKIELSIDGKPVEVKDIRLPKDSKTEFSFQASVENYSSVGVKILNQDGLMSDNEKIFYNIEESHNYSALIVSKTPGYLENILKISKNLSIDIVSPEEFDTSMNGYSLYVFESFKPESLPKDGAVWLFNLDESLEGTGFTVQDSIVCEGDEYINIELDKNTNSLFRKLTNGILGTDVAVKKYQKYGLNSKFMTLYEYENQPIIFTGANEYGNREVVFAFDLHDSNFALQMDFITLSKNLIDYSFPVILDKASFSCGDILSLNVLPSCDSIRVESPSNNYIYMDTTEVVSEYKLTEVGSYRLIMRFGEEEKVFNIFVNLPSKESHDVEIESYNVVGEASDEYFDGIYQSLLVLFIILAIIYIADWMVYCYEQYQLR